MGKKFSFCHFNTFSNLRPSSDEVIKKAYNQLEAHNWTNEELRAYEASEKQAKDAKSREVLVRQEGIAEGREEGIKKGKAEGYEEGIKKVAINMLLKKLDEKIISESTGLSVEEIKNLKN